MAIEQIYCGPDVNKAPPGWHEVTQEEFCRKAMVRICAPTRYEYRQFTHNGEWFGVQLWWMHDNTGHCFLIDYRTNTIRLFLFGCEHEYVEVSRPAGHRSGLFTSKCTKCDYVNQVDTSD